MVVTIVISNFDYGRFLRDSIDSALTQSYSQVEVVVVDDGSTDNSRKIISSYGDKIKAVFKENGGQGSAFNAGFKQCSGELVLFLDSDDRLYSDAVESVVDAWHQSMSKLHFQLATVDVDGRPLPEICPPWPLDSGDVLPVLLQTGEYTAPPSSGNVFSRAFLSQVMPVPEEDWACSADCYLVNTSPFYGAVGKVDRILGDYRQHGSLASVVRNGRLSIPHLHLLLWIGVRKQALLERVAKERGLTVRSNLFTGAPGYKKTELLSIRFAPERHPFPTDTCLRVLIGLITSTLRTRELSTLTKLSYIVWAISITVVPRRVGEALATLAFPNYNSSFRRFFVRYRRFRTSPQDQTALSVG